VLKFGDRTQIGAVHLATSLVDDLQLIAAAVVWVSAANSGVPVSRSRLPASWSLAAGALLANLVSVHVAGRRDRDAAAASRTPLMNSALFPRAAAPAIPDHPADRGVHDRHDRGS